MRRAAPGAGALPPFRVHVVPSRFREPDLVLLLNVDDLRNQNAFWLGIDLVEIVSPDHVERDTVLKCADYAAAGIPESCTQLSLQRCYAHVSRT